MAAVVDGVVSEAESSEYLTHPEGNNLAISVFEILVSC